MNYVNLKEEIGRSSYPGRGIVIGRSEDGKYAVTAYFIMGRSENSRNRIFVQDGEGIRTEAFDPAKCSDPSLIIYAPVRVLTLNGVQKTIVTNGDQTDTVFAGVEIGKSFEEALRSREFEPDEPNYTPRISGMLETENGLFRYDMSILKSDGGDPSSCLRYTFSYDNPAAGRGRFLHTYEGDGDPLPSFEGEPVPVEIRGSLDEFTDTVWKALNEDNKVSLFTRFIEIETGKYETRIINKNR